MINGKRKGASFERQVSKLLTEHFGIQFRPTPQSGAYVGGKNRDSFDRKDVNEILAGDLIAGNPDFEYCVECKAYGDDPKFHQIVQGECKVLDDWIEQAESDADYIGKLPVIIFKLNRKGIYAVVQEGTVEAQGRSYMAYKGYHIMTLENLLERLR